MFSTLDQVSKLDVYLSVQGDVGRPGTVQKCHGCSTEVNFCLKLVYFLISKACCNLFGICGMSSVVAT